jgi:hypothetical protein
MIMIYSKKNLIPEEARECILTELDELCRMISGFVKSLR